MTTPDARQRLLSQVNLTMAAAESPPMLIVSGAPATGKTTLGKRIASDFALPFLSRDGIKESLYDTIGSGDRDWSRQLGRASIQLLFHFLERLLEVGQGLVIESNFCDRYDTPRFEAVLARYAARTVQIHCTAEAPVINARYRERASTSARHPGHLGATVLPELRAGLREATWRPLRLAVPCVTVNTTDFATLDYAGLCGEVRCSLRAAG